MYLNYVLKILSLGLFFVGFVFNSTAMAAKTFVYCSEASPRTFNPQLATDGPTFNASSRTIYNRLVTFEAGGTKVIPSLATSWKQSSDGLSYTFRLRRDVAFHTTKKFIPKRKFNADDVLFTFDRMRKKDHPYHKVNGGSYEYFNSMEMGKLIKDIIKVDAYTVKFILSRPEAPFLANLAMDFASITSAEYGTFLQKEGKPELLDIEPIGTGPFMLRRYVKDNTIRFVSHPNYFEGKSKIDNLVFSITTDPSVRFQKLKTKECHLIAEPSPTDIDAMKKDPNIKVLTRAGLNVGYVAMNVEKKPFDNVLVRRAISHALNRKSYIKAIYQGNAEVAKNPIPPTMWSYNKGIKDYDYNPKKAKALLKKAGFPNGFETELWTMPVSRPYNPNGKKMGELIQADLAKVGIKVKLVTYKWATYLEKAAKGDHAMIQLGWTGDNGDPDNFLHVLLGCSAIKAGSNYARWCDKKFAKLIEKAKVTGNVKKRTQFYKQAQKIFKKEAPWVTVAHATVFKAMNKKVKNYKISPFGIESFYELDLK